MSDLPSREAMKALARMVLDGIALNEDGRQHVALVLNEVAEGRLVDRDAMTPMYRQGGMSGAWYRETDGDPPDGWLAIEDSS